MLRLVPYPRFTGESAATKVSGTNPDPLFVRFESLSLMTHIALCRDFSSQCLKVYGRLVADYTIVPVSDVPDMAAEVGMDPDHFEIRFMRESLGLKNFAVTYERFGGGWRARRDTLTGEATGTRSRRRSTSSSRVGRRGSSTTTSSTSSPGPPCASRPRRRDRSVPPARRTPSSSRSRLRRPASTTSSSSRLLEGLKRPRPGGVPAEAERLEVSAARSTSTSSAGPAQARARRMAPDRCRAGERSRRPSRHARAPERREPVEVGGHRAEVEPVRRPHGRLAEERLDRREVAAVEARCRRGVSRTVP